MSSRSDRKIITLVLDFIESSDFYLRLYSLQLLAAILSARTERTEECILTAPLGISRLVGALDDQRDAVRNDCVGLLISLTPASMEIQKLVAFENAFERIFAIVDAEGSLAEGGRTVEDCLILLANLLRRNPSNQSLFRESGCVAKLANLLMELLQVQLYDAEVALWAQAQRNRNVYAFLAVTSPLFDFWVGWGIFKSASILEERPRLQYSSAGIFSRQWTRCHKIRGMYRWHSIRVNGVFF